MSSSTSSGGGHLDAAGRLRMVDVGSKPVTKRRAVASCRISMAPETLEAIAGKQLPKGDVLAVAQVAGVMAAKRTPDVIPGCHPLRLDAVEITFEELQDGFRVRAEIRGEERTGFEMEALTASAVAALTIYDMAKSLDPGMRITDLSLDHKEGGKSVRHRG